MQPLMQITFDHLLPISDIILLTNLTCNHSKKLSFYRQNRTLCSMLCIDASAAKDKFINLMSFAKNSITSVSSEAKGAVYEIVNIRCESLEK